MGSAGGRHLTAGTLCIKGPVGAFDQVVGAVVGLQLREPDGNCAGFSSGAKHGVGVCQALGYVVLAQAGDDAHELITAEADDQVVRAELGLQRPGDVAQQPVPGGVTALVVDGLELIDVDERNDQRLAAALGPAQVTLELQETGPAQVGPGELIERG